MKKVEENCEICYQIRCRECGWIATDEDVIKIQQQTLTACPLCGWKPNRSL